MDSPVYLPIQTRSGIQTSRLDAKSLLFAAFYGHCLLLESLTVSIPKAILLIVDNGYQYREFLCVQWDEHQ